MIKFCAVVVLFVMLLASSAGAQWTMVASNLVGQGDFGNSGVMATGGGVVWAGLHQLYKSLDKGATWLTVPLPPKTAITIQAATFFDDKTGIVCTDLGAFLTRDQGLNWVSLSGTDVIFAAAFSGSDSEFVIGNRTTHNAMFTRDRGATWNQTPLGVVPKDFYTVGPGHVIAFVENAQASFIAVTTDYGKTWATQSGTMEADAHTFAVVPCNENVIFGINEEGGNYTQDNSNSELYVTKDGGQSFKSILSYPLTTLSGCMLITPGVIYLPARSMGILESTDTGSTWQTVPGPNLPYDSRDIVRIEDTIIFAADNFGSIWKRIDSRAAMTAPKGTLTVSPETIIFPTPVSPCGPSARAAVAIHAGCGAPSIVKIKLASGDDDKYFTISSQQEGDSLRIQFLPDSGRIYNTTMQLVLSNGDTIFVPILGRGKNREHVELLTMPGAFMDTVEGTVDIPIMSQPALHAGTVDLSVHYDASKLVYRGTWTPLGGTDRTTATASGIARLHFSQQDLQGARPVIAYVLFGITPADTPCTSVSFDSVNISDPTEFSCLAAVPSFSTTVCATVSTADVSSPDVRIAVDVPRLSVIPNPATDVATIHSPLELGVADVSVFDAIGRVLTTTRGPLGPDRSLPINLNRVPSGSYTVRILAKGYSFTLHLVHEQ
ncbi:MAG: hypothetical protein JSS75_12080 [Bacteroidetes bacterium]|nr:hypothetical protein [Bacteroidota bacterium]